MSRFPFFTNWSDNSPKQTGYKLYGHPSSISTWRVLAALHEKNLAFEFIPIELKEGEHKRQPYLSVNPFGQVPALTDGDLKLFESRAIIQYISYDHSCRGTQLYAASHKSMAVLTVWMEVEAHQFDPVATKLTIEQYVKPTFGMPTDPEAIKENEEKLAKVLDVYETRLQQSKYLASDRFTLADLYHLPNIQTLLGTPTRRLFETRPHVHKWVTDITGRPAWQKVVKGIH